MNRVTSTIAATTAWLAVASVVLQPIFSLVCSCDCHESSACCADVACRAGDADEHQHDGCCHHHTDVGHCGDGGTDVAESGRLVAIRECGVESAGIPCSGGCPECSWDHPAPLATAFAASIRVDRDSTPSTHIPTPVARVCPNLTDSVSGVGFGRCSLAQGSAQASCVIFCRFVI